ncbi:hypothetical protein HanRHA438_Chr02g0059761 [Helianthus annuus]|nr:hypothetical protein HanRHA438_Chr02g0059761 [Helianthus annuus]
MRTYLTNELRMKLISLPVSIKRNRCEVASGLFCVVFGLVFQYWLWFILLVLVKLVVMVYFDYVGGRRFE